MQQKTDEDFDRKYTVDDTVKSSVFDSDCQTGMFETYGKDLEHVLQVANTTPDRVWTMVDCDEGMYLISGYHLVNRIYYIITKEEAKESEEYVFDYYEEEDEENK